MAEINAQRKWNAPGQQFTGSSWNDPDLKSHPELALDYLVAPPRMAHCIEWSTKIYNVYLKYVAPEDICVYSIDEVLMDVTNYLPTYKLTPRELARKMVLDVLDTTGITATAGIGSNLYLAKVAMDIWAKHTRPDKNGVRIAEMDEMSYRKLLWEHRPLTDFWRVGWGYAKKLEAQGLFISKILALCHQPHFVPKSQVWGGSPTSTFAGPGQQKFRSVATPELLAIYFSLWLYSKSNCTNFFPLGNVRSNTFIV